MPENPKPVDCGFYFLNNKKKTVEKGLFGLCEVYILVLKWSKTETVCKMSVTCEIEIEAGNVGEIGF